MSDTIIGFDVAPLAPIARFFFTSSGSIESSQTFVPVAISDLSDMSESFQKRTQSRKSHLLNIARRSPRCAKNRFVRRILLGEEPSQISRPMNDADELDSACDG